MTRWIIGAVIALVVAVLAFAALSVYVTGAVDSCMPDIPTVTATPISADDGRPTGRVLPAERIADVAADAGFTGDDLRVAVAVALAESGGDAAAVNTANRDGSTDHGLWQLNSVHRASGFDPSRASDPSYNATWAHTVFRDAGHRWTPWVAYTTGAYRQHLAVARHATVEMDARQPSPGIVSVTMADVCDTMPLGDLGRTVGVGGPITTDELAVIGETVGEPVPGYSILRDPDAYGSGAGGPSVNRLARKMKVAVARLEIAMGTRLQVTSGYRSAAYQAELCARPGVGRCAPPGRSMHQHGLAVDTVNWRQALPHLAAVGLCQPLPADDAVHLSHIDGAEC